MRTARRKFTMLRVLSTDTATVQQYKYKQKIKNSDADSLYATMHELNHLTFREVDNRKYGLDRILFVFPLLLAPAKIRVRLDCPLV